MSEAEFLCLLYAAAIATLFAELFIPSHGLLTIVALALLIGAIVKTFEYYGEAAGGAAILLTLIVLPVFAYVTVKVWPHTSIGRRMVPPNPVMTANRIHDDHVEIESLVGRTGRSLTPLRPIGKCEFDGWRVQCICESGMLDADVAVRAISMRGGDLIVAGVEDRAIT